MQQTNAKKEMLIEILIDLLNINTCQPEGNEDRAVKYIVDRTKTWPLQPMVEVLDHGNNRSSIVLTFPSEDGRTEGGYALISHTDTVEVGDVSAWDSDPHDAIIKDGKIIGRGAADMKCGAAAMLFLAENIAGKPEHQLKEPIHFCFTADEERGGLGMLKLAQDSRLLEIKGALIPEPTDNIIAIAEKGVLQVYLRSWGRQAHASQPDKGINAVDLLLRVYAKLKTLLESFGINPFCGKCTATLSLMKSGAGINIVPPTAEMGIDIRAVPEVDNKQILSFFEEEVKAIMEEVPGSRIEFEVLNNRPAVSTEQSNPFVKSWVDFVSEKTNETAKTICMPYYTDASQLVPVNNCPFIIYGPGKASQAHQANEFIEIEELWKHYEIIEEYFFSV